MRRYLKSHCFCEAEEGRPEPALTIPFPFLFSYEVQEFKERQPEPALTIPFPANKFPNKLAPKVPKTYLKILLFVLLFHF